MKASSTIEYDNVFEKSQTGEKLYEVLKAELKALKKDLKKNKDAEFDETDFAQHLTTIVLSELFTENEVDEELEGAMK